MKKITLQDFNKLERQHHPLSRQAQKGLLGGNADQFFEIISGNNSICKDSGDLLNTPEESIASFNIDHNQTNLILHNENTQSLFISNDPTEKRSNSMSVPGLGYRYDNPGGLYLYNSPYGWEYYYIIEVINYPTDEYSYHGGYRYTERYQGKEYWSWPGRFDYFPDEWGDDDWWIDDYSEFGTYGYSGYGPYGAYGYGDLYGLGSYGYGGYGMYGLYGTYGQGAYGSYGYEEDGYYAYEGDDNDNTEGEDEEKNNGDDTPYGQNPNIDGEGNSNDGKDSETIGDFPENPKPISLDEYDPEKDAVRQKYKSDCAVAGIATTLYVDSGMPMSVDEIIMDMDTICNSGFEDVPFDVGKYKDTDIWGQMNIDAKKGGGISPAFATAYLEYRIKDSGGDWSEYSNPDGSYNGLVAVENGHIGLLFDEAEQHVYTFSDKATKLATYTRDNVDVITTVYEVDAFDPATGTTVKKTFKVKRAKRPKR